MAFTVLARAKINWSLNILGVRPNGYHELDMLMQQISLSDELVFEPADALSLTVGGAPGDESDLVLKAARALAELARQRGMETSGARICLTKRIPSRAGLGGGSADCAETLKALNRLWNLNFPMETMLELGAKLGADVPFCLTGGLARVSGVGERIEPLRNPPHCALVLITPGGGLSTPEVFRAYDEMVKQGEDFWGKHAENAVKYSPENPTSGSCMAEHSPEAPARGNCAATECTPEALTRGNCAVTERSPEALARENCAAAERSPEALARGNCAATEHSPLRLAEVLLAGDYALAERLSFNALEAPAIRLLPEIGKWINRFRELGARYVRMTGSGSTVFGVFDSLETARAIASQIPGAIAVETIG